MEVYTLFALIFLAINFPAFQFEALPMKYQSLKQFCPTSHKINKSAFDSNPILDSLCEHYKSHAIYYPVSAKVVETLVNYLNLFGAKKCLLLLDNYKGVNIQNLKYPLILRQLRIGVYQTHGSFYIINKRKMYNFNWVTSNLLDKLNPSTVDTIAPCDKGTHFTDGCHSEIESLDFESNSKPWNCQFHVSTSLPSFVGDKSIRNVLPYPAILRHKRIVPFFRNALPSNIAPNHLVVVNDLKTVSTQVLYILERFDRKSLQLIPDTSIQQILLLHASTLKLSVWCDYCEDKLSLVNSLAIASNPIISKLSHPPAGSLLKIFPTAAYRTTNSLNNFDRLLLVCENYFAKVVLREKGNADIQVTKAIVHLWLSVFNNFTYRVDSHKVCKNGNTIYSPGDNSISLTDAIGLHSETVIEEVPFESPFSHLDESSSLRFVYCSSKQLNSLSFKEFYNVFDPSVWLLILLSGIWFAVGLILLRRNRKEYSIEAVLESLLRLYLEQADLRMISGHWSVKISVALVGFMCLVLSNAYRNDNVYNMVLPRKTKLLNYFMDLVVNNYTVQTRTSLIHLSEDFATNKFGKWEKHGHSFCGYGSNRSLIVATSEINVLRLELERQKNQRSILLGDLSYIFNTEIPKPEAIIVKTHISPLSFNYFILLLQEFSKHFSNATYYTPEKFRDIFWKQEETILFQHLHKCNKSALVLPNCMCSAFAAKLREKAVPGNTVHVGAKESFFKRYIVIRLTGPVPPFIILRAKQIYSSGIIGWWSKLLQKENENTMPPSTQNPPPEVASLRGNVVVIFVSYLSSSAAAALGFILELISVVLPTASTKLINVLRSFEKFQVGNRNSRVFQKNLYAIISHYCHIKQGFGRKVFASKFASK